MNFKLREFLASERRGKYVYNQNLATIAVFGGLASYFFSQADQGSSGDTQQRPQITNALECILKQQSQMVKENFNYYNQCNVPIVVRVCEAQVADTVLNLFGVKKEPYCSTDTHKPGDIITIASDYSSHNNIISSAISTSSMEFMACFAPKKVEVQSNGQYLCKP